MNRALIDPIADAVLYEGYILYPYRPSLKNRQRWTFGGLYPEGYCRGRTGADAPANRTECLVRGGTETTFEVIVRFLHLTDRRILAIDPPLADWREGDDPPTTPVESLRVDGRLYQSWQEAEPREVASGPIRLGELAERHVTPRFAFGAGRRLEPIRDDSGAVVGLLDRRQEGIEGVVEVGAMALSEGLYRVVVRVANRTEFQALAPDDRDGALMASLVSTHAMLGVEGGSFVSLTDPPDDAREAASACHNQGVWPVLVGDPARADMMLSSPIIMYDYPEVAPESPGDFFDGAEIDEMLTLRIMTLTDDEKAAMTAVDPRAGLLLSRTEAATDDQRLELHGTVRGLRPSAGGGPDG